MSTFYEALIRTTFIPLLFNVSMSSALSLYVNQIERFNLTLRAEQITRKVSMQYSGISCYCSNYTFYTILFSTSNPKLRLDYNICWNKFLVVRGKLLFEHNG